MFRTMPLANAFAELQRNFDLQQSNIARAYPELVGTFRTAAIKSFEYSYEESVKLIRLSLESRATKPDLIEQMDFLTIMHTAAKDGLIDDPRPWSLFREQRNNTFHTSDESQALDALSVVPQFIAKATFVLNHLSSRPDVQRS